MISNRGFFLLVVPILWSFVSVIHFRFPGDEYGLWVISSIAGSWVLMVVPGVGDINQPWIRSSVAGAGALVMAVFGCVLCWLKVRILFWLVLWLMSALTWLGFMLSGYPSLERALAKNGSWWAYLLSAALMAAYTAILISMATGTFQLILRRLARKPPTPPSSVAPTP
jgi:hypothetical protein